MRRLLMAIVVAGCSRAAPIAPVGPQSNAGPQPGLAPSPRSNESAPVANVPPSPSTELVGPAAVQAGQFPAAGLEDQLTRSNSKELDRAAAVDGVTCDMQVSHAAWCHSPTVLVYCKDYNFVEVDCSQLAARARCTSHPAGLMRGTVACVGE